MKRHFLVLPLISATLFLAGRARADDAPGAPAAAGELRPGSLAYQQLLQRYDTNHDGKLDESELAAAHEQMAQQRMENGRGVGKKIRQELLQKFDKNHNGRLDPDEREAARQYFQQHVEERRKLILEHYDKNGDGKLDENERAAMREDLRRMRERRQQGQGAGQARFLPQ
ncbi:MAG TPA: EF-hand domain-containing protein [Opitutaceae bacterium]|nr:EF-hand domain-containing protein [Opitutaceae bacterium]